MVEEFIRDGRVLLEPHPNQEKFAHQVILLFHYEYYWWVCPAIELEDGFFLKTIFPSRKVKEGMENEQ